jgi:Gas vesicle synthesis protein GvpO
VSASRRDRPERARGRLDDDLDEEYEPAYDDAGYDDVEAEPDEPEEPDEPAPRPRRRAAATVTRRLSAGEAAGSALSEITALTGRSAEGVTSVRPQEGGWVADVELLEARRVPSSSDTLALYEVVLDEDGDLVSYRRLRRYPRGRSEAS